MFAILHRYEFNLRDEQVPEIQRVPLEQLVLRIKVLPLFKKDSVQVIFIHKTLYDPESS